jgi:diguanylate cyclase (GGDEF)-like protein
MFAVLHCAFARSRSYALAMALCAASPLAFASGDLPLEQRIADIRELNRFVPERALPKLEALEQEARNAPLAQRIEFLNQLAMARHGLGHHGQSFTLANELIALGREYDHAGALAKGLLMQGYSAFAQHRPSEAHRLVWEAEKLANTTDDIDLRVRAAISSGESHAEEGNLPRALERLQSAAALARRQGEPVHVVMALNSLVRLYSQMREPEKGFGLLDEALAAARKANSPGRMATIRNAEYWLAIDTGQRERALQEGLALERSIGATKRVAVSLINLSDFYLKTGDFRHAASYAEQAVAAARPLNDRKLDATAHLNLGQAYLGTGRLADGKRQIELGMAGYEEIGDKPELQNALVEYGLALERVGDLPGALQAYHRERKISNELFERRRQQAMLDLQEKYEGDKKQRQIELLRSENLIKSTEIDNRRLQQRVWWLLVAVFALAATVVGLLYRKVRHANAQLHEKNRELKQQSVRDPLTGLYNRRHFLEYMRALPAARGQANEQATGGALFLLDVDHFKNINDTYGHAAGDAVLTTIAARLCEILRETDMIVRWGGEEFLAYLPTAPAGTAGLDEVAERILAGIGATVVDHAGTALSVNVSIGYAPFPLAVGKQELAWERVVNLVDMALYLAKSHGRNRAYGVRGFADDRLASIDAIEQNLEHAWRAGQVDLSVVMGEREPLKAANG